MVTKMKKDVDAIDVVAKSAKKRKKKMMTRKMTSADAAGADAKSAKKRKKRRTMKKTSADAAVADAKSAKKLKGRMTMMVTDVDVADAVVVMKKVRMLTPTTMKLPSKPTFTDRFSFTPKKGNAPDFFQNRGGDEFSLSVPPEGRYLFLAHTNC